MQLKEKNDIKIFVLYLLRNIGYPLDFATINDIVVQDGYVTYFDFTECFAELLETGNVQELRGDGEDKYLITEQGSTVADALQSKLVHAIREQSLKSALRLLSFRKRGASIECSVCAVADSKFEMQCTVVDQQKETLRLTVLLDDEAQAQRMQYHFTSKPEVVYRGILALLSGEVDYLMQ